METGGFSIIIIIILRWCNKTSAAAKIFGLFYIQEFQPGGGNNHNQLIRVDLRGGGGLFLS